MKTNITKAIAQHLHGQHRKKTQKARYFSLMVHFCSMRFFFIVFMLFLSQWSIAQEAVIRVKGKVLEERGQPVPNSIVLNTRTKKGAFGSPDGSFVIECNKSDTLTITCLGYYSRQICFKDSTLKLVYYPRIFLNERTYSYSTLNIFAPRDLEDIQKDIQSLGYNEDDYMLSGINAVSSPITFLYQQLSRKEESKRIVAKLENDDRRRDLLKELFTIYVDYKIIELSTEDFDDFISYLNVSDEFMKSSSQYEFLVFVKDRFQDYQIARRNTRPLKEGDFDYDKD
jgi:hypothetical protein